MGRGRSYFSAVPANDRRVCRCPPQRVDENSDRAPGRADGLDFPAYHPVVDGPAAHVDELARLPDRNGCPSVIASTLKRVTGNRDRAGRTGASGPLNTLDKTYRHRVAGAAATAYTWRVSDTLAVAVECYAGYRGEETPRRFTLEGQLVEVEAVVDRWRTPDHRGFRVRTAGGEIGTLRQDVRSGVWE